MKFTSIFFTASADIFEVYFKYTKKRGKKRHSLIFSNFGATLNKVHSVGVKSMCFS